MKCLSGYRSKELIRVEVVAAKLLAESLAVKPQDSRRLLTIPVSEAKCFFEENRLDARE